MRIVNYNITIQETRREIYGFFVFRCLKPDKIMSGVPDKMSVRWGNLRITWFANFTRFTKFTKFTKFIKFTKVEKFDKVFNLT